MEEFFTEQFHKLLRRHDDIEKLQSFSVLAGQAFAVAKFLIAIQPTLAELKTGEKHRHHTKRLQTYLNFLFSRPDAKVNSELLKLNFYVNLVIGLSLKAVQYQKLDEQILTSLQIYGQILKASVEDDHRFFQERFLQAFNVNVKETWPEDFRDFKRRCIEISLEDNNKRKGQKRKRREPSSSNLPSTVLSCSQQPGRDQTLNKHDESDKDSRPTTDVRVQTVPATAQLSPSHKQARTNTEARLEVLSAENTETCLQEQHTTQVRPLVAAPISAHGQDCGPKYLLPAGREINVLERDEALRSIREPNGLIHDEATLVMNTKEYLSLIFYLTEEKGKEIKKLPTCNVANKRGER
ncbi:hypothetical protein Forpe1208_v015853 [Fusarium oxysporum f. sp. rapae]|uniref:Uncharacterized protein n=1 Tax=Fusarium oxysporum f. sp. rapae TaxID=485398 RepID=A0A8J5NJ65_FUSOX|nr:hypothetical protein Forpe1208_v015853 [Fusarium oxysporum f. sp. rapae]